MYSNVWDEVINNGNLDEINGTNFDKDITLVYSPESIVGIENFKAYYRNFTTGFSDVKFTIVDLFGQDDKLVKHWKFVGKHTGDFFGMSATGNIVNVEGTTLVKMKDGKIAQEQDFMDNMVFMQQLGIVSSPENVSIIEKLYNDFKTGDIPAVGAVMDTKIVWNEAENFPFADGNPYIGFDAIRKGVFARIGSDWEYWNLTDINLNEMANNKVLATGRYQAKYKKNGAVINLQMAHLWTLKDGKIISFQQYADTKGIVDVMKK
ncbi:ester cyclase [Wocania ichthyoenteri]|uniref:ester cyclase n=1 Tax=Wocania ichthyoenteri TaxID=1230531 RepID=UPI000A69DDD9|nr:ester cyclase [Wocania ichthyoenteri]